MALGVRRTRQMCGVRSDRVTRSDFLTAHLKEVRRMLNNGLPILGYLHWSLTDNYDGDRSLRGSVSSTWTMRTAPAPRRTTSATIRHKHTRA